MVRDNAHRAADLALWTALSNLAPGRADLDVMRQALNVAVLVAGSACSVPLPCSLRAGPAAGTARVQPWWGKVNVGAVAGALRPGPPSAAARHPVARSARLLFMRLRLDDPARRVVHLCNRRPEPVPKAAEPFATGPGPTSPAAASGRGQLSGAGDAPIRGRQPDLVTPMA